MIILAVLAASAGFYISLKQSQQAHQENADIEGMFWPNPKQIQDFNMLDHHGKPFGLEQLAGKWSLIFFGYTHCPDICPITMSVMTEVYKEIGPDIKNLQIIFTTVDPERDTTEKLLGYVSYFNEHFIGLGGTTGMVDSLTRQIGIAYYINNEDVETNYLVDHSASLFLISPNGHLVGKISPPHQKNKIIQQFNSIKNFIDAQY